MTLSFVAEDDTPIVAASFKYGDEEGLRAPAAEIAARAVAILDGEARERYFAEAHAEQCALFLAMGLSPGEAKEHADRLLVLSRVILQRIKFEVAHRLLAGLQRHA